MKGELEIITEKQITLREDSKMTTEGISNRLIAIETKLITWRDPKPPAVLSQNRKTVRQQLKVHSGMMTINYWMPAMRSEPMLSYLWKVSPIGLEGWKTTWLLCQGMFSFSIPEFVSKRPKSQRRLAFKNKMIMSQPQVMKTARALRQSINLIVQAWRKKTFVDDVRGKQRRKGQ